MTCRIRCSSGKYALIDPEDYEYLSKFNWNDYTGYPRTFRRRKSENNKLIGTSMHALILKAPKGLAIDHINGNTLDNRKKNLRIVTSQQNGCNRKLGSNNTTGYKGVTYHKRDRLYQSSIKIKGKRQYLGWFKTAEEAANAYNKASKILHGEFGRINEI